MPGSEHLGAMELLMSCGHHIDMASELRFAVTATDSVWCCRADPPLPEMVSLVAY
jgi:hypothetical protein